MTTSGHAAKILSEALMEAVRLDDMLKASKAVAKGANVNCQSSFYGVNYSTPLCLVCGIGSTRMAKFLLHSGANPNQLSLNQGPPLSMALVNRREEIASLLIASKAEIRQLYLDQCTPLLHIACEIMSVNIVLALLNAGADVNRPSDFTKETALHIAVRQRRHLVVKCLIAHGADVNYVPVRKQVSIAIHKFCSGKSNRAC